MRILAALLLLACSCWAGPPEASDLAIEEAIRARFAKSKIAPDNFHVKVSRRVATLTGKTDVVQHKGTATRLAKAAGASSVVNKIEVSSAAREKAAAVLAEGRKAAKHRTGKAGKAEDKPEQEDASPISAAPEAPKPGPGTVPPPVRRARVKH